MEQKEQIAYSVDMEVSDKAAFWADGDCMNSADAPIRLRNGQRLSAHRYDGVFTPYRDIEAIRGKICVFQYITQGNRYFAVKEIVGIDEITGTLRMVYYNPQITPVSLKIEAIEKVYFVDGVE